MMNTDELFNVRPIKPAPGARVYDALDDCWGDIVDCPLGIVDNEHVYIKWADYAGIGRYPLSYVRMSSPDKGDFLPASF